VKQNELYKNVCLQIKYHLFNVNVTQFNPVKEAPQKKSEFSIRLIDLNCAIEPIED